MRGLEVHKESLRKMDATQQPIMKIPPQNIEAERATLGAMLLEKDAIDKAVEMGLDAADFYHEYNKIVFKGIMDLYHKNEPVDLITISNRLIEKAELDKIGGTLFLTDLISQVPTAAGIEHYTKIVRDRSVQRKLIKAADEIINTAYHPDLPIDEILGNAEAKILDVAKDEESNDFVRISEAVKAEYYRIAEILDAGGTSSGIKSGFANLDKITAGLHPAELFILAARPSMGKTAFALNIAKNVAMKEQTVAFFSLEMSRAQLAMRILCSEMKLNQDAVRKLNANQTEEEQNKFLTGLMAGIDRLWETPLYINDTPGITVPEMRSKLRRMQSSETGLHLVVIDYLQLITGNIRAENRTQEISQIARELKALAREFNVPVIALSQLSRMVESRSPKRPQLSDLRESGAIEQDADVVAFLYRPAYYKPAEKEFDQAGYSGNVAENLVELIIAKQRNGPTDTVFLDWYQDYATFTDSEYKK